MNAPVKHPPRRPHIKLSFKQHLTILFVAIAYLLYKLDYEHLMENPVRELVDFWGIFILFVLSYLGIYYFFLRKRSEF